MRSKKICVPLHHIESNSDYTFVKIRLTRHVGKARTEERDVRWSWFIMNSHDTWTIVGLGPVRGYDVVFIVIQRLRFVCLDAIPDARITAKEQIGKAAHVTVCAQGENKYN